MKKLIKFSTRIIALVLMVFTMLSMTACEDIKKAEVNITLYNKNSSALYEEDKVNFSIELYRHLAPESVDAITGLMESGYYNDTFFYVNNSSDNTNLFIGDLKFNAEGKIVQNTLADGTLPATIKGEFEANGVKGSNLATEFGSIGVYRSYYANDGGDRTSSDARDSGRATLFLPTATINAYDKYYAIIGKYDVANENVSRAINGIKELLNNSEYSEQYVIYYTGEYDSAKPNENYGLTFNCVTQEEYTELTEAEGGIENLFEAEGEQLVSYNVRKIKVAKSFKIGETTVYNTAGIKSVTVK